jgi:hypothetical protein
MSMAKKALIGLVLGGSLLVLGLAGSAVATHTVPASAPSLHTSLVPVYKQCNSPSNPANSSHNTPLAVQSCNPPNVSSSQLLIGSGSVGYANVDVLSNGSDVSLVGSATDIRNPSGGDYNPQPVGTADAFSTARIRFTDHNNCTPAPCVGPFTAPGTGTDLDFGPVPIECTVQGDPTMPPGSTCSVTTSANGVVAGSVVPGKQSNVQIFRIRQSDYQNTLASQQGIFIP